MTEEERERTPAYIARCRTCHAVIGAMVDDNTHHDDIASFLYECASSGLILERTTVGEARALFGSCTCEVAA